MRIINGHLTLENAHDKTHVKCRMGPGGDNTIQAHDAAFALRDKN